MARPRKTPKKTASPPAADSPANRRLPIWKKALFALAATALFFVLLELLLWGVGVDPLPSSEDAYVGFAGGSPLYVAREEPDGRVIMVTAETKREFFGAFAFPREKPQGVVRIFCLGGSTTYGRPNDHRTSFCGWMGALLPEADPSRQWELINAGGMSYASYRLVRVMEELTQYQPDVFVVYMGHNEFLERRTYPKLVAAPSWLLDLGSMLSKTRIYAGVHALLAAEAGKRGRTEDGLLLPAEVETMLDRTVGPEAYSRSVLQRPAATREFRRNLERMAAIAREAGARIVFVRPACNLKDMSPFKSEAAAATDAWTATLVTQAIAQGRQHLEAGHTQKALDALRGALEQDAHFAELHYELGRALFAAKEFDEAREAFQRAVDEDVCPLRASSSLEQGVLEVAATLDVPIVDFRALLEEQCQSTYGHRVLGEEYFLDHVHPSVTAHRTLALALIEKLAATGVARGTGAVPEARVEAVSRRVLNTFDRRAQARAQCNLAAVLLWAGKTGEALRYARDAVAVLPDTFDVLVTAGIVARIEGRYDEAVNYLQGAVRHPAASPFHRAGVHYELGRVFADRGDLPEALQHLRRALDQDPRRPGAHAALGSVLARMGRHEEAIEQLEEGLETWPDDAQLHLLRALEFEWQGDDAMALERLERSTSLRPGFVEARYQQGRLLEKARRWGAADRAYAKVMRLEPLHRQAWLGRGRVLAARGMTREAREHYERLVRLAPKLPAAHAGLAEALAAQAASEASRGDRTAARETARLALTSARRAGRADLIAVIEKHLRELDEAAR